MKNNIAVYGGAFNPPTLWHFGVMQKLLTSQKVEKIIFTPDGERLDKNYGISPQKRQEMMQVFVEDCFDADLNVEFESHFLNSDIPTTTLRVEKFFSEKYCHQVAHIFWIDVVKSLPNWSGNSDKYLEQKLKKLFVMRKGFEFPDMTHLQNFEILDLDILEISSTTVRQMIKNKLNIQHILTPKVFEFVMDEKLYV